MFVVVLGKNSRGSVNGFADFSSPCFRKVKTRHLITSKLFGPLQEGSSPSFSLPLQLRCLKRENGLCM